MEVKIGNIEAAVVQRVGNKNKGEGISFSSETTPIKDAETYIKSLIDYSFKYDDLKTFDLFGGLKQNPVYIFASKIFDDHCDIVQQANNLARYLYDQSIYQKIKTGEFYVVTINNCTIDNAKIDAIGLFKSESHDTILKIENDGKKLNIHPEKGMSLKKLDKGCIIFNKDREKGYIVATVDHANNIKDSHYWTESFLHVVSCQDEYHDTRNVLNLFKDFIITENESHNIISKADAAIMVNRSIKSLKSNKNVSLKEIAKKIFDDKLVCKQFHLFKQKFEDEHNIKINDDITTSAIALKKKNTEPMTTIKLDVNFEVKILGEDRFFEKGFDKDKNMNFYKLYYHKEE